MAVMPSLLRAPSPPSRKLIALLHGRAQYAAVFWHLCWLICSLSTRKSRDTGLSLSGSYVQVHAGTADGHCDRPSLATADSIAHTKQGL